MNLAVCSCNCLIVKKLPASLPLSLSLSLFLPFPLLIIGLKMTQLFGCIFIGFVAVVAAGKLLSIVPGHVAA